MTEVSSISDRLNQLKAALPEHVTLVAVSKPNPLNSRGADETWTLVKTGCRR